MNILITGCNGQLGHEMQLMEAQHAQHTFFNTDVAELDITDCDAVSQYVSRHAIDGIVNCAAYTAVDRAETDPALCDLLNHQAPAYLAEAVARRGGWLIQVSTDYVFNGTAHTPYRETDAVSPESVYGRTKLAGEQAAMERCPRTMVIRTAWLYSTFGGNFVKTMLRLGREKQELGVIADQVGTPTYARDLADAIFAAISQGVRPGIYHFTDEGVASWYDFTKAIHRLAGITGCRVRPLRSDEYPTAATRPHYSVLDKTKIKHDYGLDIPHWEESLAECISRLEAEHGARHNPGTSQAD